MKTTTVTLFSLFLAAGCTGSTEVPSAEAAATVLAAPVPTPPAPPAAAGDATTGASIYKTYCVGCHQADGTGMGGMLAADFVADPSRLAKSDAELLAAIADGVTGRVGTMPPWRQTLSDQERRDVLSYLRATWGR